MIYSYVYPVAENIMHKYFVLNHATTVPQGNILGLLLFSIYINDLPLVTQFSTMFIYTDDVKLCRCVIHISDRECLQ